MEAQPGQRRPRTAAVLLLLLAGCGKDVTDDSGMIRAPKIDSWTVSTDEVAFRRLHKDAAMLYQKDAAVIALWYSPERAGFGLMMDYANPQSIVSWVNERATFQGVPPTILESQAMIVDGQRAGRMTYEADGKRVRLVRVNAPKRWFAVESALPAGLNPAEADQALDQILADVRLREQKLPIPAIFTMGPGFAVTMILVVLARRWLKK